MTQANWSQRRSCRSEEHTSELQSRGHLVCRLLPRHHHYLSPCPTRRSSGPDTTRELEDAARVDDVDLRSRQAIPFEQLLRFDQFAFDRGALEREDPTAGADDEGELVKAKPL